MEETNARYSLTHDGDTMTASLFGEIDHHSAKSVRTVIDDELYGTHPKRLKLDLGGVSFMDSSGLGLILGRMSKAEEIGCRVVISGASDSVFRMLDLAGIGRLIKIECKKTKPQGENK